MNGLVLNEEPIVHVGQLGRVPIAFRVDRAFEISDSTGGEDFGRYHLVERALAPPYMKDYDAIVGNSPSDWPQQFDLANWVMIGAWLDGVHVGGVLVAMATAGVELLEGRNDLAVLWDFRVSPEARGRGVGSALFRAVETFTRQRGCRELKVETQNINVPACRFYAAQGCVLSAIIPGAYPEFPHELQMLWRKSLIRSR